MSTNVPAADPSLSIAGAVSAPVAQNPPLSNSPTNLNQSDIDVLSALADEGVNTAASSTNQAAAKVGAEKFAFPSFDSQAPPSVDPKRVTMLSDVNLRVKIELGRTRMLVEDVLKLSEGSVVELDKLAGDPVDVYANDRLVARGEILVLDESFCVRISDVVSRDPHRIIR